MFPTNKRILLVNDHIQFGGGGDAVIGLEKRSLEEEGYQVFSIGFGDSTNSNDTNFIIDLPNSAPLEKVNKFFSSSKIEEEFCKLVSFIKPDLIHIHLISKFPLAIYNSSVLKTVPVIQTLHGPNLFCATAWGGLKNSASCELGIGSKCYLNGCTSSTNALLYWQLQKRYWHSLLNVIDLFHCPSLNILNSAQRLGLKKTKYIPLGIDEVFMKEPVKTPHVRPTLIYVGAIARQKGVQFLLPALKKIKETYSNILLKVAGRGILLDKLKQEAIDLKLEDNIELLGFVPHEDIRDLYLSGDLFLMPSIWQEQFGLVGPEALACKVPCIGSNVGGIPEWLRHNDNGLLIPPQNSEALANAVIDLLQDETKRKKMGENGRRFVIAEFAPNNYKTNLLNVINSLI